MDEPTVDAVEGTVLEGQLPQAGEGQPQPTATQDELRKLQGAKDREIADLRQTFTQENAGLRRELDDIRRRESETRIAGIEDPDERAQARIKEAEEALNRKEQAILYENEMRARPIVMAMISQRDGVPVEVLQPARSALEMENLALRWKLESTGKELEKATKPGAPAATGQKFAQGAGTAQSSYDSKKFVGTGDLAGSLRAKREAGL